MYSEKFEKALKFVLDREGGYVNDPADKGGKTSRGITENTYLTWQRKVKGKTGSYKDIKDISLNEVKDIYWDFYWEESKAEDYSFPLSLVIMDTATNFGVSNGITFLEESLGLKQTGIMTDKLDKLLHENDNVTFALKVVENRLKYRYKHCEELPSQKVFLQGWVNRDNFLREEILKENKSQNDIGRIQYQDLMAKIKRALIKQVLEVAEKERPKDGRSLEDLGNNWGVKVGKYLNSVGIDFPAPWCMAFSYWSVMEVLKKINYTDVLPRTGDTWALHTFAQMKRISEYDPQSGDLCLFYWGSDLPAHVGIVVGKDKNNEIMFNSIEGNTNGQGSSEGNTIALKTRFIQDCKFVRWINLISGDEVSIQYKGKEISRGVCLKGSVYAPIREVIEKLGSKVEYIKGIVYVNNQPIPVVFSVEGNSWGKVRNFVKKSLSYDNKSKVLTIGD